MKKVLALVLALVMVFALCACGQTATTTTTTTTTDSSASTDTAAATTSKGGTETVKIICPYGAGGVADAVGRKFAEVANSIQTDYNFIVENMTGGDGFVANEYFAAEDPMEHDLIVFGYGACYRHDLGKTYGTEEVNWDRTLTYPLGTIDDRVWVLYGTPDETLADVIAKAQAGDLKMSGGNPLSDPHLVFGSLLAQLGGTVTCVPYDGGAEQKAGLVNGEVDVFVGAAQAGLSEVEAGTLVPLLAFTDTEFTGFKDASGNTISVPTIAGDAKSADLPADMDFTSSIMPGGGSLASHVNGDADFQAAMVEIIKNVWATDEFSSWIAESGLNHFECYAPDLADFYNTACEKSLAAYDMLKAAQDAAK